MSDRSNHQNRVSESRTLNSPFYEKDGQIVYSPISFTYENNLNKSQNKQTLNKNGLICPIKFYDKAKEYEGCVYKTRTGSFVKVIEYINSENVTVEFLDDTHYIAHNLILANVKSGSVKNPYLRSSVHGGYLGEGPYNSTGKYANIHKCWDDTRTRCYGNHEGCNVSYIGVSVDPIWDNYQNFAEWATNYLKDMNPNVKYNIDKDILQWKVPNNEKIYSPETCCFIPEEINQALVNIQDPKRPTNSNKVLGVFETANHKYAVRSRKDGKNATIGTYNTIEEASAVYKNYKETKIRDLATFYYNAGALKKDIYDILMNLTIE